MREQVQQQYGNRIDEDEFDPDDAWGDVKKAKQNISDYQNHLKAENNPVHVPAS